MAFAYRASTSQGSSSGGAVTVNKPAGTVDGDLIVVVAYLETDANTWASVGAGFSSALSVDNTGAFKVQTWYKWASGEPASWTWTPTTSPVWRSIVCASYSGGGGSGEAKDQTSSGQVDGIAATGQTAPSVTTTAANDLLTFGYGSLSGTDIGNMQGAASNLRVSFGGTVIADANIASAGATGTSNGTDQGTQDYAAIHAAFFLSPGGAVAAKRMLLTGVG